MYGAAWCGYCARARRLLTSKGAAFTEIDIDATPGAHGEMIARTGRTSVPQIFIDELHIGGFEEAQALDQKGGLDPLLASAASA